jgi:transposase InsO family protein
MCAFFEVSRSGYYDFVKRVDKPDRDKSLAEAVAECQEKTKKTYGYRRVKIWLTREKGKNINHKAILRIMNKYNLLSEVRRNRAYVKFGEQLHKYENILSRDFKADKPNQKWVTDISYIITKQGTLYLSMIRDLYDNFVVAYNTGTEQTINLVTETIKKAKREVADGLLLHSDQGGQYTSPAYHSLTKEYNILPSMSRAGNPLDNAMAENFFSILKSECINRFKPNNVRHAKSMIDEYIYFYNFERIQLKTKLTPFEKRCQLLAI